jgi:hypothetical protein
MAEKLTCQKCGTQFVCGPSGPGRECWCAHLPNRQAGFDLADACLCPDCLTAGQARAITAQRKIAKGQRKKARARLAAVTKP